ncbi:hypothetical protein BVC93_00605 [Mycobacterium sp. MS1601]|uniref:hypothetical protein n=1 Tax=Mycobacterium sp. MS1601 TaxID=1936029 RepID=UPI000979828D|nr:hypothetical protein [Mycobacterium sp. MS1601]AQA01166.1 hypothetical protein BVC93_00605 [Mycobacterium sp. MS1601]
MSIHTLSFTANTLTPLPRGLREQAREMSWDDFLAAYGHTAGPLELIGWECTDTSRRFGPQVRSFAATVRHADGLAVWSATATGSIAALTDMLYQRGFGLEMLNFHQLQMGRDIVTFIRGTDGTRDEWAMAWAEDGTQSALRAVIACANRLAR